MLIKYKKFKFLISILCSVGFYTHTAYAEQIFVQKEPNAFKLSYSDVSKSNPSTTIDGIFVTTTNSTICYKLEEIPSLKYSEDGKSVSLYLQNSLSPSLSFELNDGNKLEIVYGTYNDNTNIKQVVVSSKKNGKFLYGGRLIIISKGKKYNLDGTLVK